MNVLHILRPDYFFNCVEDIPLDLWWSQGIKGLILDVDDTLTRKNSLVMTESVREWLQQARGQGFQIVLVSNNRYPQHIQELSRLLEIPAIAQAGKPRQRGFLWALKQMGLEPQNVVAVGDRVLTDVVGGSVMRLQTCLVRPVTPQAQLSLPKKALYSFEKLLSQVK